MLTDDMGPYERNVDKYGTKYMWNQNEFDALVFICIQCRIYRSVDSKRNQIAG